MDLTLDEQRLITEFRKLTPSGKDELFAGCVSLVRRSMAAVSDEVTGESNQCRLKTRETRPETDKIPIFTE